MMKQQQSILQWASHVLEKQVVGLKAIRDVKFLKVLLFKIDDLYFQEWQQGGGEENYQQVLAIMAQYFNDEIGTDLSQHFSSINLDRNFIEIWQLVLAIAIKGNNRNNNINIFFELDHQVQVELVTTVSNILDKFGQNTAPIEYQDFEDKEKDKEEGNNDRKMVIQLLQENEEYRQQIKRLQHQLLKEKEEKSALAARKNQLQQNLSLMKLQKLAFFQIMTHATNSDSKIFQDGQGGTLEIQSNLSQLAQDIVQFILQQRNKISQQIEKNDYLSQKIRDLKMSFAEQKQLYANQIEGYTSQLQELREEHIKSLEQNEQLISQIAFIQESRDYLSQRKQVRQPQIKSQIFEGEQANLLVPQKKQSNRLKKKNTMINAPNTAKNTDKVNSSQSSEQSVQVYVPRDSKEQAHKRQMNDQLREHQLQKEIAYLKKKITSLNKQNEILKSANEGLQKSAKNFMDNNKNVITKWQDDYEVLIQKITALNEINDELKQQSNNDKQQFALNVKAKNQILSKLKEKESSFNSIIQQKEENQKRLSSEIQKEKQKNNALQIQDKKQKQMSKQSLQKFKKDKTGLWQQIVNKLKELIREGKNKQLSYQNSLLYLRNQNDKLLELLRSKNTQIAELKKELQRKQAQSKAGDSIPDSYFINIQKVQSQEMKESKIQMIPPRLLSFIDAEEDNQQQREAGRKSFFYGVTSKIVNDFHQNRQSNNHLFVNRNEDYYNNLNSKLTSSIRSGIQVINNAADEDLSQSVELQRKMQEQIKNITQKYQVLNNNYQNVFNKLHIYTQNLKEKEFVKKDYENVLEEITKAEIQVKATHEAQIVKLRILNQALQQQRAQSIIQKEQFAQKINKLSASIHSIKERQQKQNKLYINQIQNVLKELSSRYNQSIKDPLNFIEQSLSSPKDESQIHKLYRLYIRQREKTKQLNEQLQLLSSVLLEYRNMLA